MKIYIYLYKKNRKYVCGKSYFDFLNKYIYISLYFICLIYKTYYFDNLFQIKFLNFFKPLHIKDYFI